MTFAKVAAVLCALAGAVLLACQGTPEPTDVFPTSAPTVESTATAELASAPAPGLQPTLAATTAPAAAEPGEAEDPLPTPNAPVPLGNLPPPPFPSAPPPTPAPGTPSLSEVPVTNGPIRTEVMESRDHFPSQLHIGEVEEGGYNTVPPTSGRHWDAWSDCGFYNYPLPDELLVHNLEHGNIIISYNLDSDDEIEALRQAVEAIPFAAEFAIVRRYDRIPEGMVALTTWGVLDRMMGVDPDRIAGFIEKYPANTGPEFPNGLPCTTGVQMTQSSGG